MPLTYASYLKVEELLALQQPLSDGPEHDEMLFIVIHQVYELWFKEMLHELDQLVRWLEADQLTPALHTLKRCLSVMKILVAQIDILETMTPLEFLSFRDRLETASGFQSYQFRELEFLLGHKRPGVRQLFPESSTAHRRLSARLEEPTIWDIFLRYLERHGYAVPADLLARDVTQPVPLSPKLQSTLVDIYRRHPPVAQLCERLLDLDEGFQEWRYRHVKMVERTIGAKPGTGGSAGVEYLKDTLFQPFFPDLWAIRAEFNTGPDA
ncbi:MAG: tryptophan 2,3-dioxygenase [Acidobacteria bacterium]|nr:tryptophan 2,3-dioxygenase [Acidobacteriota bacterium]